MTTIVGKLIDFSNIFRKFICVDPGVSAITKTRLQRKREWTPVFVWKNGKNTTNLVPSLRFRLGGLYFFLRKRFVSGILDLTEILACNQLQNANPRHNRSRNRICQKVALREPLPASSSRSSLTPLLPSTSPTQDLVGFHLLPVLHKRRSSLRVLVYCQNNNSSPLPSRICLNIRTFIYLYLFFFHLGFRAKSHPADNPERTQPLLLFDRPGAMY